MNINVPVSGKHMMSSKTANLLDEVEKFCIKRILNKEMRYELVFLSPKELLQRAVY